MRLEPNTIRNCHSTCIACIAALGLAVAASVASAGTLDRIRTSGHIKLGYLADARPFTFQTTPGVADGYAVELCKRVVVETKKQLGVSQLTIDWIAVPLDNRLQEVRRDNIDLLCTPMPATLTRRGEASFSIPVYPAGVRAVLRADAPTALRDALAEAPGSRVVWRGSPAAKVLEQKSFAVVAGTTTESLLKSRLASFQVNAKIVSVDNYQSGLRQVIDHKADAFFGERTLIDSALHSVAREDLQILDRLFTSEQASLALARGDEDFRLLIDRTLSQLYASEEFRTLYSKWFGEFNDSTRAFFLWNTVNQ